MKLICHDRSIKKIDISLQILQQCKYGLILQHHCKLHKSRKMSTFNITSGIYKCGKTILHQVFTLSSYKYLSNKRNASL